MHKSCQYLSALSIIDMNQCHKSMKFISLHLSIHTSVCTCTYFYTSVCTYTYTYTYTCTSNLNGNRTFWCAFVFVQVCTLWYRAPELLFGASKYGEAIFIGPISPIIWLDYTLCVLSSLNKGEIPISLPFFSFPL